MEEKEKTNNIADYLAWRADIPLSVSPFNEMDNLLLCLLGYAGLRGIVPHSGATGISEIRDRYFEVHKRENLKKKELFTSKAVFLLDDLADGARFGGMTVDHFIDVLDTDKEAQIEALTFFLDDGTAYVCFCGTDDSIVGWKENFEFSFLTETIGQSLAVQYLNKTAALTDRPLRVGGHSKGGNFAVYAAAFAEESVQDRIIEVYANDAPGFREEVVATENYRRIVPKVISIVPDTSIIGQLLEHTYPDIVIKSNGAGLMQHDGFTWCVKRDGFIRAERSDTGRFVQQVLKDWLGKMDDTSRQSFIKEFFALIESAEVDTLKEMNTQKLETAEKIIAAVKAMPKDQQKRMRGIMHELVRSGGDTAAAMIREEIDKKLNRD